jgi:hypothetical protein
VDHQRVRVLAVDEPGFGGGHLAVGGQPGGLAVRRPDADGSGLPGVVNPGAARLASTGSAGRRSIAAWFSGWAPRGSSMGLSIRSASSVTSKLTQPDTLHLTTTEAASIGTVYLIGEVIGALVFGKLSDEIGRGNYSCGPWRSTWPAPG